MGSTTLMTAYTNIPKMEIIFLQLISIKQNSF